MTEVMPFSPPAPAPPAAAVGSDARQRYRIITSIGRGGMAELLLAAVCDAGDVTRLAVIKRIWPELASDPDFLAMFLDEARLAVRMNHPNVVRSFAR